jgi:hypothetical protein
MVDIHPRGAIKKRRPCFSCAKSATGLTIGERPAAASRRSPYARLLPSLNCQKRHLPQVP